MQLKTRVALNGIPVTQLRDVTCHMGSHSITRYPTQVNAPRRNPSLQVGTQFTCPGVMEGCVDLGYLAVEQLGVELVTSRSQVRCHNYTTKPPSDETRKTTRRMQSLPGHCDCSVKVNKRTQITQYGLIHCKV